MFLLRDHRRSIPMQDSNRDTMFGVVGMVGAIGVVELGMGTALVTVE